MELLKETLIELGPLLMWIVGCIVVLAYLS